MATNRETWRPSTRRSYQSAIDLYLAGVWHVAPRAAHADEDSTLADAAERGVWRSAPDRVGACMRAIGVIRGAPPAACDNKCAELVKVLRPEKKRPIVPLTSRRLRNFWPSGKSIALTRCSRLRLHADCDSVKRLAFDGMTSILKVGKFVSVNSCNQ